MYFVQNIFIENVGDFAIVNNNSGFCSKPEVLNCCHVTTQQQWQLALTLQQHKQ